METKAAACSCLFCGRVGMAFVAPLLCARFSDLGWRPGDETEHSIVGPLLRFPL